jgi:hypothetical protein
MRSRDEIRDEVFRHLMIGPDAGSAIPLQISREVDRRYHCERILEEAEAIAREHRPVRIEFVAVPDDHLCRQCRILGGRSVSLEDFKKDRYTFSCRCAIVLPDDEE